MNKPVWYTSRPGNGSGGFGFGVWRNNYERMIVWIIAIGPITIHRLLLKETKEDTDVSVS